MGSSDGPADTQAEPITADIEHRDSLMMLIGEVKGMREDFDKVLPHVVNALSRDKAFDELSARLE